MTLFKAFRNEFGYTHYGEQRLPVMLDVPLTLAIYYCVLTSIAFLVYAGGIRGKERWYTLIRLVYVLLIGSVLLGHFKDKGNNVDYNEDLILDDSGPMTEPYNALDRGLPEPILMVLEHFEIDEGGLRFGRNCKFAGYFAGILLWTGFAFWIAANIILCSVVWHGAVCCTISGVCVILAIVVYNNLNPSQSFRLPGSQGHVQLRYGWCIWFNLTLGILTTLLGIVMIVADYKYHKRIAAYFFLETALEDHLEYYPHRYAVSLVQDNKNDHRGQPTMLNPNPRYGSDSHPNQNENPIMEDSNCDVSTIYGRVDLFESDRGLSILKHDITCSVKSTKDVVQRDVLLSEEQVNSTSNRFNTICVDIDRNIKDVNTNTL